ncbi:MAG: hypothetical protein HZB46_01980 [Solirubrobacterales bacterium]|nr:hypothetical protein [Solirubrobacterales bacterium]
MGTDAATPPADRAAREAPVAALPRIRRRTAWLAADLVAIASCLALVLRALA